MEIKNKNIFLNLNADEKIVYVVEKTKFNFWWNFVLITFFGLPIFTFFSIISILHPEFFGTTWESFIFPVLLPVFYYGAYKIVIDYFFTEIILTNQRFIISRLSKIYSIYYDKVDRFIDGYGGSRGSISTTIKLKDNKNHRFLFVDKETIRGKFKEIYPSYDDSEIVAKEKKRGKIILAILLLLLPFFMYAEYKLKLSSPRNRSYKSAKHRHDSKEPYFNIYMEHLQDKMKSNWNPPRGQKSSNVVLLFKVDRNGKVLKARVLKSSNNIAIDKSALEALKKSEPLEPLPKEFKGKDIDVQFQFDYNVFKQ